MTQTDIDTRIRTILTSTRVIGLVGLSHKPERASYRVARFLSEKGYRVIGVNPGLAGQEMFGETVVGSIAELPEETDMIDLFRRSETIEPLMDEALAPLPNLRTVWMQLEIFNAAARAKAEAREIEVVEDRCPAIEYPRLIGTDALAELVG